jgi:methanogenic corrinoid protein MtbC1
MPSILQEGNIMATDLVKSLSELREDEALAIVRRRLDADEDPLQILDDCRDAMGIVGERYEREEYFIPHLVYSGEILKEITEMIEPKLAEGAELERFGKVVIGTVAGDIHDIGKNIVTFMLEANGFDVHDLGVDVPAQKFIDEIEEFEPQVVGLSGFLTLSFDSMKETVEAIKQAGLRDKVKIMIGGGTLDESLVEYTGADAFRRFAGGAVSLAKEWVGGK